MTDCTIYTPIVFSVSVTDKYSIHIDESIHPYEIRDTKIKFAVQECRYIDIFDKEGWLR